LQKAEILTTYCGVNLDEAWMSYMQKQSLTHTLDFKQRVVNMGIQMLSSLEKLHAVGFVHQDIKLDNICVKDDNYYLIDFGYAHRLEPTSSQKKKKEFKGNSMFSSHRKFYNSDVMNPYDDIESLLYLLCYCLCGFWLPWLHDYFNQRTANEFFTKRITNCHQNNQMLYNLMPPHMVKAL
jgi:serine/threonine protein kinase